VSGLDLVQHDALTPYALLAADAIGVDLHALWRTDYVRWPDGGTYLQSAVLRHLGLFGRTLRDQASSDEAEWDNVAPMAQSLVARALQSADTLQRFLARKRETLPELVMREADDPTQRAAATWAEVRGDQVLSRAFDEHMVGRATCADIFPVDLFPEHGGLVVDVGGGPGHYLVRALAAAGPRWRGVLLDTYDDAGWWATVYASFGLRLERRLANVLTQDLPAADVYVLGSLLHDLTDADSAMLLQSCSDSARKGSRLVIIERWFDPGDLRDSARDLDMQILFGGRERTLIEYNEAVTYAGFASVTASATPDGYHVLTAVKEEG